MNQIIGGFKEFLVIKREELDIIENNIKNERNPNMSDVKYAYTEGVLSTIEWIKENNIYNQGFEIKK